MTDWIGQTIGKVRIERYLARGGMAEIFLGTHLTLDRSVAVKVMHSYVESEPDLLERFQREAKAVAGLRHPNIVQIFDYDTHEGHPYIVMEYLNGPSLAVHLRSLHKNGGRFSLAQIAQILKPLASGMDYAHSQGIIHRDIKPANIILTNKSGQYPFDQPLPADTECVITDFGLVRVADAVNQTASGVVSGTPAYMSPEQAQGNSVDYRTDIYSLSVVLYEMLAGRPPFDGDSTMGVILKHISEPPPPIEDVSPEIQAVVNKGLQKTPEYRYQSARELLKDYYEAVGMHAEAETLHSLRFKTPPPSVTNIKKPAPRRSPSFWIGAGIFACLCVGLFAILGASSLTLFPNLLKPRQSTSEATPVTMEMDHATDQPGTIPQVSAGDFSGILRFQGALDQITINGTFIDPGAGFRYEAWLVDDSNETRVSLGTMENTGNGSFTLAYLDPESRNLLDGFNRMEVTLEADPDSSPNPSDTVAYSSAIPSDALTHIRHVLVGFGSTPGQIGMGIGLTQTSQALDKTGEAMETAFDSGNEENVRASAEAMINLIVGSQSADFKDWDGNGRIENLGDGFGLLLNGSQAGYIEGTITHAELAAAANEATANIQLHSEHVAISGGNVEGWAAQLRDIAKRILESPQGQIPEADVRLAVSLADQILNGIDLDGSESVDPIEGEGGSLTAFQHAEYMADMQILEGENQIPPPGTP